MATIKHTNWLALMLGGGNHTLPDMNTDDMEVSLIDDTDVVGAPITAAFEDYDEIDTTPVANVDVEISVTGGVASSTGATFTAVSGDAADYLVLFKNSGTPSTSPLVITWDSATTGLPVTPNGGNIVVTWGSNTVVTLA